MIVQVRTRRYDDDLLSMKKSLSHMETLLGVYNGCKFSEPSSKFGWTFFKINFSSNLQSAIEIKFADMLSKYRWSNQTQKFVKFMNDYFNARGSDVTLSVSD